MRSLGDAIHITKKPFQEVSGASQRVLNSGSFDTISGASSSFGEAFRGSMEDSGDLRFYGRLVQGISCSVMQF